MTQTALTPEQLHALFIIGKRAKPTRKQLKAGKVPLDFTLRVTGALNVAADFTGSTSAKPDVKALAKALLAAVPKTRRVALVDELVKTKLLTSLPDDTVLDKLVDKLVAGCTLQLSGSKRGAVTGKFETLIEE